MLGDGTADHFEQHYRCNSLFDPDYTGIGHQPYGFDQWKNFYQQYYVYKAAISVSFNNNNNVNTSGNVYLERVGDPDAETNISTVMERPGTRVAQLILQKPVTRISMGWRSNKRTIVDMQDASAYVNANPTDCDYWRLGMYNPTGTAIPNASVTATVRIKYWAVMFDTLQLSRS